MFVCNFNFGLSACLQLRSLPLDIHMFQEPGTLFMNLVLVGPRVPPQPVGRLRLSPGDGNQIREGSGLRS